MANPFVHVELQTQDVDKSKKFYASMFDWKLEEIPGMDYTVINVGEGTGGGIWAMSKIIRSPLWLTRTGIISSSCHP